jgi:hypothetical protein
LILTKDLIPEKSIVIFCPHYDDTVLMLGGYVSLLRKDHLMATKTFTNINIYSRSNYQQAGGVHNYDRTLPRIQLATGIRLMEDVSCLDDLFGRNNYQYVLLLQDEALVRGFKLANDEMEFPKGNLHSYRDQEWEIFNLLLATIQKYASLEDTALIFPMSIRNHIDHFILRHAAAECLKTKDNNAKARFYFVEDKPYAGLASLEEWQEVNDFFSQFPHEALIFPLDTNYVDKLLFKHYPSQTEEVYRQGLYARASYLRSVHSTEKDLDRILRIY